MSEPRMLIVHPWVVQHRGGERTFYQIARTFPNADLALFFDRSGSLPPDIARRVTARSFLQHRLFSGVPYRALGPLLPLAAASIDADGYDVILSSSSGWAHGVHADRARHLCYMYSPPRYVWSSDAVPLGVARVAAVAYPIMRSVLRRWDTRAAGRVHAFAAISQLVRRRIYAHYGCYAAVIYPPVDVARMQAGREVDRSFALSVGELVPYKRFDVAIGAAKRARVPLVIVGDGPERRALEVAAAGADVTFVGRVGESRLVELMARARVFLYPALEDFGIVTVEALASGTPVVGLRRGGTGAIVQEGMGELVDEANPELIAMALNRAWTTSYDRQRMRSRAAEFAPNRFSVQLRNWVDSALTGDAPRIIRNRRSSSAMARLARYA